MHCIQTGKKEKFCIFYFKCIFFQHFEEIGVTPKRYSKTRPSRLFVKQPGVVHTADVAADGDSSWITDPSNDTLAESETKL